MNERWYWCFSYWQPYFLHDSNTFENKFRHLVGCTCRFACHRKVNYWPGWRYALLECPSSYLWNLMNQLKEGSSTKLKKQTTSLLEKILIQQKSCRAMSYEWFGLVGYSLVFNKELYYSSVYTITKPMWFMHSCACLTLVHSISRCCN